MFNYSSRKLGATLAAPWQTVPRASGGFGTARNMDAFVAAGGDPRHTTPSGPPNLLEPPRSPKWGSPRCGFPFDPVQVAGFDSVWFAGLPRICPYTVWRVDSSFGWLVVNMALSPRLLPACRGRPGCQLPVLLPGQQVRALVAARGQPENSGISSCRWSDSCPVTTMSACFC